MLDLIIHPWKLTWNQKNRPIEQENHLPNGHLLGSGMFWSNSSPAFHASLGQDGVHYHYGVDGWVARPPLEHPAFSFRWSEQLGSTKYHISDVVDKDRRHNNFQPHCQADDTRRVLFPALKLAGHSLCWASWRSGPHGGFIFFRDSRGYCHGMALVVLCLCSGIATHRCSWFQICFIFIPHVGKWLVNPVPPPSLPKQWSKGKKPFPIDYEQNLYVRLILYC